MTKIQLRHDTSENWTLANPILLEGEIGIETNTNKLKVGDGTTSWNSLDYFVSGGGGDEGGISCSPITNCLTSVPSNTQVEIKGDFVSIRAGQACVFPFETTSKYTDLDKKLPVGTSFAGYKILDVILKDEKWFVFAELENDILNTDGSSYFGANKYIYPAIAQNDYGLDNSMPEDGSNFFEYYGIDISETNNKPFIGFDEYSSYYSIDTNAIYANYTSSGLPYGLPVGQFDNDSNFNPFKGFGHVRTNYDNYYSAFVYSGVSGLIPDGYDENTVIKSIPVTSSFTITEQIEDEEATFYLTEDSYIKADVTYDKETNLHYTSDGETFKGVKCQQITRVDNNYDGNYDIITEKPYSTSTSSTSSTDSSAFSNSMITSSLISVSNSPKFELNNAYKSLKTLSGSIFIFPYGNEDLSETYPVDSNFISSYFKVVKTKYTNGKFYIYAKENSYDGMSFSALESFEGVGLGFVSTNYSFKGIPPAKTYYGETAPTETTYLWYDTTENLVKVNSSGSAVSGVFSLPAVEVYCSTVDYTFGVQHVSTFDGIGYIGSTIWVDEGVKYLTDDKNVLTTKDIAFITPTTIGSNMAGYDLYFNGATLTYKTTASSDYTTNYPNQPVRNLAYFELTDDNIISVFKKSEPFRATDVQDIDGIWVNASIQLLSNYSVSSSETKSLDLSNSLPNDNEKYEILIICTGQTSTTSGTSLNAYISTNLIPDYICLFRATTRTSSYMLTGGNCSTVIGADRTLKIILSGSGTIEDLKIVAYRKVR